MTRVRRFAQGPRGGEWQSWDSKSVLSDCHQALVMERIIPQSPTNQQEKISVAVQLSYK